MLPARPGRACQILRISERTRTATALTYVERVNRAIDHVVGHLDEPLRLRDLARAALLSPFHFHRVFQALLGSTPAEFVQRLRLEKAVGLLSNPRPPSLTAVLSTEVASATSARRRWKRGTGASNTKGVAAGTKSPRLTR